VLFGCDGEDETPDEVNDFEVADFKLDAWRTDRGTLAHAASLNDPVTLPLEVRWTRDLELGSPTFGVTSAVGGHGNLYVGGDFELYALNPADGTTVWTFTAGGPLRVPAVTFSDDKGETKRVYFATPVGSEVHLFGLDAADGSQLWTTSHVGGVTSALNGMSGVLFYTTYGTDLEGAENQGLLRAVQSSDGSLLWEAGSGGSNVNTPLHAHGKVYASVGGDGATGEPITFSAHLDGTGELIWGLAVEPSGLPGQGNLAKYSNGVIDLDHDGEVGTEPVLFVSTGTNPATLFAIEANSGEPQWQVTLPDTGYVTGYALTQGRDENVLVVSRTDVLYRIDRATGEIVWQYDFGNNATGGGGSVVPRPAIWGDYVFHVVDGRERLVAVSLETGAEEWSYTLDDWTTASPMVTGHSLYLGTHAGTLYAFSPGAP